MTNFLLSLLPVLILIIIKTKKSFHMLQQNWYNDGNRYFKWILKNKNKLFLNLDMFFIIFLIGLLINNIFNQALFFIFYLSCIYLYRKNHKKEQVKLKFKFTKRVRRLTYTTTILYLLPIVLMLLNYNEVNIPYYYLIIGLLVYINPFIVIIANYINKPWEKGVYYYYYNKAKEKLKRLNPAVIGITGSYGKTSSKNILNDILNVKFNSFATPKNFNTDYGLMLSINNHLDKFSEIFIAEMGAFKKGEIKKLCNFVKPKYGILTKIGTAHLESFGSQENIQTGKFELIESLPEDGAAILNMDDELQVTYNLKNKVKTLWIAIDNKEADAVATNIKLSNLGTEFDILFKGDKEKYHFSTKLLGRANVYNILAGVMLGKHLGMKINELQRGVEKVKPIEHRLELKKYLNINIIDDAYNSNPIGSKMALDVLGMMPGKKIIVTPGMIELADKEYELNKKFGEYISEVADEVILVGEKQTKPIYDGLIEKKYNKKNIHILDDVKKAFPLMQELSDKETFVLLENDLPDIFNEG